MSYQDNLTLGEIKENDVEMAKSTIKKARRYTFTNKKQATFFVAGCILKAVEWLGVKNAHKLTGKELDAAQKWNGIKIERRTKYRAAEDWRNGWYLFKNDELVAFVSEVNGGRKMVYQGLGLPSLTEEPDKYHVITNVKGA